jgi:RNA polymerase sigma factor (sigma-70 family)
VLIIGFDDGELVTRACRGNVEAYSSLVKKYSNAVYATALSIVRDFHIAQDVAQEAFVKAWFRLDELKGQDKFGSWLCIITRRLSIDCLRKNRPTENIESYADFTDQTLSVEAIVDQRLLKETVWAAINQLDETKRLVTIMYFISGFNAREISTYLNLSVSAVESRIKRAKVILRKELFVLMENEMATNQMGQEFHDEVLWKIVPRIVSIELPVSNLLHSIGWYNNILGTEVVHETVDTAMLRLQGGDRVGVPSLYLVQTDDKQRISFINTNTKITHSVIDFFVPDLERFHVFLTDQGVEVTSINYIPELDRKGGFGFKDLDGNSLSACNVTFQGQV